MKRTLQEEKRTLQEENRTINDEWELQYFRISARDKINCLLRDTTISTVNKYNVHALVLC